MGLILVLILKYFDWPKQPSSSTMRIKIVIIIVPEKDRLNQPKYSTEVSVPATKILHSSFPSDEKVTLPYRCLIWFAVNRQLIVIVELNSSDNCIVAITFSNSLIIHEEKTKEITTMKEVWICDPNYHKIRRRSSFPKSSIISINRDILVENQLRE